MTKDFRTNNFDILRLFAATEVLLLHSFIHLKIPYPAFFNVMLNFPGVPMFFVMSGFLLSASLERNPILKNYFKNRAFRIYPALWFLILLTIIVIYFAANISFANSEFIPWVLSQLAGIIYTPGFLKDYGIGSYNGSLWTIPLEIQFYFFLPALYFLLAKITGNEKLKTGLIVGVFIAFFMIAYVVRSAPGYDIQGVETQFQKILRYTFIPNIYLFILGIILQRYHIFKSNLIYNKGWIWLLAYVLYAYLIPVTEFTTLLKFCFLGITTISLAYTVPALSAKLLRGNDISYGIYIYHGLILGVIVNNKTVGSYTDILLIIIFTLFIAVLSWHFIEKPVLRRKKEKIKPVARMDSFKLIINNQS